MTAIILFLLSGCGGTDAPQNSANANLNTNTANANGSEANVRVFNTTRNPEDPTSNTAPALTPVVLAYYEALKKKDEAGLRKVYSKETLKSLEADMKADGKTSLIAFITELEPVPDKPFELRNEQIQGDVAVAEMRGGAYPNGIKIKFIRENGEWKMTNESPDFNTAK